MASASTRAKGPRPSWSASSSPSSTQGLRLTLEPAAKVTAVHDAAGTALPFLRHALAESRSPLGDREEDEDLLVVLPSPLRADAPLTLAVDYELQVINYVDGRSWYPDGADSYLEDRHHKLERQAAKSILWLRVWV